MRLPLAVSALLLGLATLRPALAAEASPLQGTWTLTAAGSITSDGKHVPAFGPNAEGRLIVDANGRYTLQIYRGSAEPADKEQPAKVFKAAQLVSAHYGHITLDPQQHLLTFSIDAAYSPHSNESGNYTPNWNGTMQTRPYTLNGDDLSYQVPPTPGNPATAISVWHRVSPGA
ncbi:Lipocalin-like domain-containing protein [Dyella sp. OK004]|uniref:lipocalin-like domain-containing protein n=1 Tax=Dyella sp. OK004 TaxID=1855292 RepID=UPI0008EC3BE3|nr:lipocalin-like domain-containing protein [Dyella sp. OK004]SFR93591.1 Lipocalin-like domain-containing protein [Dyella sp. OK004]